MACIGTCTDPFLSSQEDDRHHYTVQLDTIVNDLDLHSRSHVYGKAETSLLLFSQALQGLG